MRVAIIHDWLVHFGGAERVLEELLILFPQASLYSTIDFLPATKRAHLRGKIPKTTFCQKLPFVKKIYGSYLPLLTLAIENLNLSSYDLVLSSSHAVAKGVITAPEQLHLCYCHSPMRYAWDLHYRYAKRGVHGFAIKYFLQKARLWDLRTSFGVDHFIANSHFVAQRIEKCYRRKAHVIYPPVDVNRFSWDQKREDYYVTVSRLVTYKNVGFLVEAFSALPTKRLVIIGEGPERKKLEKQAPNNITFLGEVAQEVVAETLQRARAFVFAGIEDFGIALVEAQAAGTPLLALNKGGAKEIVQEGITGLFFEEKVSSFKECLVEFENRTFSAQNCRKNAERFSKERFHAEMRSYLNQFNVNL